VTQGTAEGNARFLANEPIRWNTWSRLPGLPLEADPRGLTVAVAEWNAPLAALAVRVLQFRDQTTLSLLVPPKRRWPSFREAALRARI